MLSESEVLDLLRDVGAFRTGHFVYTSGRHGDAYILKDAMYAYPRETSKVCKTMAEHFKGADIEAVIGPAIGAAILSQWTAYHLCEIVGSDVSSVYADKDGQGGFVIKRGYDKMIKGKRTLVGEGYTQPGGGNGRVVEAARAADAEVAGVVVLANRGGVREKDIGNPPKFVSLVNLELESWEATDCDLCKRGIPVSTDIGHGKEFLASGK